MANQQHILIVGAGICGLAIAHGLKKADIPFTIFEAEEFDTFRPREWTMALHWSIPMLESLLPQDLAARLRSDAVVDKSLDFTKYPNNTVKVVDGRTGALVKQIQVDGDYLRVSRRKLRNLCKEQLDIKYGHTLECVQHNADGSVIAKFTNGASHTGTILVGTDGPRSQVRRYLFGDEEAASTPLDIVYLNVHFSYHDAHKARFVRSAHPVNTFTIAPGCAVLISMQDVDDPEDPSEWQFQVAVTWKGTHDKTRSNQENRQELNDKAEKLPEPYRSAILWMPQDLEILYSELGSWVPKPWDTHVGTVTLAGDAAHSMPPNRGQGLNHALNDAFNFVNMVKDLQGTTEGAKQAELVNTYSDEVVERGAKETLLSKDTAYTTLDYANFMNSGMLRHGMKRMPEEAQE